MPPAGARRRGRRRGPDGGAPPAPRTRRVSVRHRAGPPARAWGLGRRRVERGAGRRGPGATAGARASASRRAPRGPGRAGREPRARACGRIGDGRGLGARQPEGAASGAPGGSGGRLGARLVLRARVAGAWGLSGVSGQRGRKLLVGDADRGPGGRLGPCGGPAGLRTRGHGLAAGAEARPRELTAWRRATGGVSDGTRTRRTALGAPRGPDRGPRALVPGLALERRRPAGECAGARPWPVGRVPAKATGRVRRHAAALPEVVREGRRGRRSGSPGRWCGRGPVGAVRASGRRPGGPGRRPRPGPRRGRRRPRPRHRHRRRRRTPR